MIKFKEKEHKRNFRGHHELVIELEGHEGIDEIGIIQEYLKSEIHPFRVPVGTYTVVGNKLHHIWNSSD